MHGLYKMRLNNIILSYDVFIVWFYHKYYYKSGVLFNYEIEVFFKLTCTTTHYICKNYIFNNNKKLTTLIQLIKKMQPWDNPYYYTFVFN